MDLTSQIEPMAYYIVLTYIVALIKLDIKNKIHRTLIFILTILVSTEVFSIIFALLKISTGLIYSLSMMSHIGLSLYLTLLIFKHKKAVKVALTAFLLFSSLNLLFFEGYKECNFNTFIIGSLIYLTLFIYESFYHLIKENFIFFTSNKYILLGAPIMFFLGLSFIFGFKSKNLAQTNVFGLIKLYDFINIFVNLIFYTFINIFIYREKNKR